MEELLTQIRALPDCEDITAGKLRAYFYKKRHHDKYRAPARDAPHRADVQPPKKKTSADIRAHLIPLAMLLRAHFVRP